MSGVAKGRLAVGLSVIVAILAVLVLLGWWLFRIAYGLSRGLELSLIIPVMAALGCTAMIVFAIHRSGASRAARLRGRAEAYEAALALVLRAAERQPNRAEWRRVRARLLLWGSNRVVQEFTDLPDGGFGMDLDDPDATVRVAALIRAMRLDLGLTDLWLNMADDSKQDGNDDDDDDD